MPISKVVGGVRDFRACRQGNWKELRLPEPFGNGRWQAYDLANDPGELHDLAAEHPECVNALAEAWDVYARSNGIIELAIPVHYAKPVVGQKY